MRALEVVVLDKQRHPSLAVLEVGKHRARKPLLPHRLPESLDLPTGLWMMRAALHMGDPVSTQLRLKLRGASPGRVLPALVRQDLPRRSILRNATCQRLQHQRTALMMRHTQTHQVARMIIQKRRYIHSLMPSQQKREQI